MSERSDTPDPSAGKFDFGLSQAQERRAARLHADSIIFDLVSMYAGGAIFQHYPPVLRARLDAELSGYESDAQALVAAIFWPFEQAYSGESQLVRDWMLASGLTCGAFDIDVPGLGCEDPLRSDWDRLFNRYTELPWLRRVRTASDIRQAKADGVIGLYPFYQPVVPLTRDLGAVDCAFAKGLRSLMLTYNRMDHVGVGCMERVDAGLSLFGVDLVERCNALGIVVDVSHCGPATTFDACRVSRKPVTANHSGAHAVFAHPRCKSDDALKAIADTGGVIGIVALPYFLSEAPDANINAMLDHIEHVFQLVGQDHVAIGTDWPIQAPDKVLDAAMGSAAYAKKAGWTGSHRRDVRQKLLGFADCRDLANITRGLVARGYDDDAIRAVLGENALRVFAEVCGV